MTPEEFGKKLKTLQFKKVVSVNGGKGYLVHIQRDGKDYCISCYAAPDMKPKPALAHAWTMMLKRLADEFHYSGDLARFE